MTHPSGGRFALASAQGGRDEQQDASICLSTPDETTALVVVTDGVGGQSGGRLAAQQVVRSAERFWEAHDGALPDPRKDLATLCRIAHEQINIEGAKRGVSPRATIVALYLTSSQAYWVHSGDSRLYHFRAGKFVHRTEDHSVVQIMVKQRLAKEEEISGHADQGLLIQSLGGEEYRPPTVDSTAIGPEDSFLLCTDGFWQAIDVEEMEALSVTDREELAALLEQAARRAVQNNGRDGDNVTVALALPADSSHLVMGDFLLSSGSDRRPETDRRNALLVAAAFLFLALLAGFGMFVANRFLSSKGVRDSDPVNAKPPALPQQLVYDDEAYLEQLKLREISQESTPQPTASPDQQVNTSVSTSPAETPATSAGPAAVDGIDPDLVGKWQARTEKGIETWIQNADGGYILSGPIEEKGTATTEGGILRQYYPSRNLTQELVYQIKGSSLFTITPDGKRTEWRTMIVDRKPHLQHHHPGEPVTFWQRIMKILHLPGFTR
jgi:PPM family protein phosphatase